ncbi:MAG: hypothetical protein KGQ41_01240 [Alphaproteobacteria bacterium]|nr:hypothetical protein [Alphaproteobacteria bacterium]
MSDIKVPVRVLELLCSRVCHDVVSPVAAISNGVELLTEMGADGLQDSVGLLTHAARQASVRLQMFRLSYGAGGSEALITGKMIYEAFNNYIESDKVKLEWDLMNATPDEDLNPGFFKVLVNAMLFARETLIRGGVVRVTKDGHKMFVEAVADNVTVREGMAEALRGELAVNDLTPKTIHPYVTYMFAKHFDFPLECEVGENTLKITISYTPVIKEHVEMAV